MTEPRQVLDNLTPYQAQASCAHETAEAAYAAADAARVHQAALLRSWLDSRREPGVVPAFAAKGLPAGRALRLAVSRWVASCADLAEAWQAIPEGERFGLRPPPWLLPAADPPPGADVRTATGDARQLPQTRPVQTSASATPASLR
jgi:hypothetical protein